MISQVTVNERNRLRIVSTDHYHLEKKFLVRRLFTFYIKHFLNILHNDKFEFTKIKKETKIVNLTDDVNIT